MEPCLDFTRHEVSAGSEARTRDFSSDAFASSLAITYADPSPYSLSFAAAV